MSKLKMVIFMSGLLLLTGSSYAADSSKNLTIKNNIGSTQTFYVEFSSCADQNCTAIALNKTTMTSNGCVFGTGQYSSPNWVTCSFSLAQNGVKRFVGIKSKPGTATSTDLAISAGKDHWPQGPCPTTMAELNFVGYDSKDSIDVSLIQGMNYGIVIENTNAPSQPLISAISKSQSPKTKGVFPQGCNTCTAAPNPAVGTGCPVAPFSCQKTNRCIIGLASVDDYTVTFSPATP